MKKAHFYIIFWILYFLFDTSLEAFFISGSTGFTIQHIDAIISMSLSSTIVILPVKMAACYSIAGILYTPGKKIFSLIGKSFIVLIVMALAIIFRQLIIKYAVTPYIYNEPVPSDFFTANRIATALLDILLVSSVFFASEFYFKLLQSIKKERDLVKEKLQSELNFLKAQINPHFLFNTLNNIYALARKKSDDAPDAVMQLSKLLRYMLYETSKEKVLIEQEVQVIKDYIHLQKLRYKVLNIQFKEEIDNKNTLVAPLILLHFVENAFKHGISDAIDHSFITIHLQVCKGALRLEIENSYEGKEVNTEEEKIGVKNITRQLELLYPKNYHLQMKATSQKFITVLTLQLNEHATV